MSIQITLKSEGGASCCSATQPTGWATRVAHGPEGGDLIIGGRVAEGKIRAVLFFRDPLTAQPHEPDVSALMRVCDVHSISLATNRSTAEAVVDAMKNT